MLKLSLNLILYKIKRHSERVLQFFRHYTAKFYARGRKLEPINKEHPMVTSFPL